MKKSASHFRLLLLCLMGWLGSAGTVYADSTDAYGGHVMARVNGQPFAFPALKTDIHADIRGDLATVTVVQTFANPLSRPVHAGYLFPLNKDAAVYAMTMEVGDETIVANIKRKAQAKKTFQQAQQEGKSAALLTQHRPNMFTQQIANLMPGLPIKVTLRYVHTVPKVDGRYRWVAPLVVGPRFQPPHAGKPPAKPANDPAVAGDGDKPALQPASGQWELEALPAYPPVSGLTIPARIEPERVAITIALHSGMPLGQITSSTHAIRQQSVSLYDATISLDKKRVIDNRDFVLQYALAGRQTQAGLLSFHDRRGGYFSLMIEPPEVPVADQISAREMVFVLDCSGSMGGLPMAASKAFMREALHYLRPTDTFRIIRFSDTATEFSLNPIAASAENIQRGMAYTDKLYGSGGTMMTSGIGQAFSPPVPKNTIRMVFFLTDGYIGNEMEILNLIHKSIGPARLFAFGVGTGVNRLLLSEMGHAGRGFTRYLNPAEDYREVAKSLAARLQSPVLTDVRVDWGGLKPVDVTPAAIPDLFAGQSLRVQGRFEKAGDYTVTVHGKVAGRLATLPLKVQLRESVVDGEAIALVWARAMIKERMRLIGLPVMMRDGGQSDDVLKQAIIDLGLTFSLSTEWTSFVAVSDKVYNTDPGSTVEKPVPLPGLEGVGPGAYGGTSAPVFGGNAAPEPGGLLGLLWVLAAGGLVLAYRRRYR